MSVVIKTPTGEYVEADLLHGLQRGVVHRTDERCFGAVWGA